jgi:hypothetical protein
MSEAGPTTRAFERVGKVVTVSRVVWFVVALAFGGIGSFIGFLMGEGGARVAFDAKYQDHEKRITSLEIKAEKAAETANQILGKLNGLEGKLDGIGEMLRAKVQP